ncbi:MAG: 3,4-dihydroxy-2-butanone-4-phosphate synthase [Planctomycetota bacterium]|nr:3,4-dihydroxy-2-butanone-4-phosphate synthase [Planctomycetota bacterium]MDA1139358.1 3,4-dihydroxy-2-butanone-4-phosphate synthase [Planctomycetota bacterium]
MSPISEIIDELQQGKMVILVDAEDRENEGDLLLAAEKATPEAINFMLTFARGFLCMPISNEKAESLRLHPMVEKNTCHFGTPFTVTIDACEGISTGVSVNDRWTTIQKVLASDASPDDFVRPGHMFPLRAAPGGVLERAGHTEGAVELMRLASLQPVSLIAEIMNPDGSMAKMPQLQAFSMRHSIKICTIQAIRELVQAE